MNKAERKKLRDDLQNDPGYKKMLKEIIRICEQMKKIKEQEVQLRKRLKKASKNLKKK